MRLRGKGRIRSLVIVLAAAWLVVPAQAADDPLASWNDGPAKQAILAFVATLHRRSRRQAIGINLFIGKRPQAAFGNSSGDREMLEWTQAGDGARLMMLVLHDDAEREYAYGPANGLPDTKVGTFSQSLMDEAKQRGWTVICMKNDWNRIFPTDGE